MHQSKKYEPITAWGATINDAAFTMKLVLNIYNPFCTSTRINYIYDTVFLRIYSQPLPITTGEYLHFMRVCSIVLLIF